MAKASDSFATMIGKGALYGISAAAAVFGVLTIGFLLRDWTHKFDESLALVQANMQLNNMRIAYDQLRDLCHHHENTIEAHKKTIDEHEKKIKGYVGIINAIPDDREWRVVAVLSTNFLGNLLRSLKQLEAYADDSRAKRDAFLKKLNTSPPRTDADVLADQKELIELTRADMERLGQALTSIGVEIGRYNNGLMGGGVLTGEKVGGLDYVWFTKTPDVKINWTTGEVFEGDIPKIGPIEKQLPQPNIPDIKG